MMAEQPVIEATPEPVLAPPAPPAPKKSGLLARLARGIILGAVCAAMFDVVLGLGMGILLGSRSLEEFVPWVLYEALQFGALGALLGGTLALLFGGLLQRKKVRAP